MDDLTEEQTRVKLQITLDYLYAHHINYSEANLLGGYVEFYIAKMHDEFGETWNPHGAREFINSLAAENDLRNI